MLRTILTPLENTMTTTSRPRLVFAAFLAATVTVGCSAAVPDTTAPAPSGTTPANPPSDAARCRQLQAAAAANPPVFDAAATWNQPAVCLGTRSDSARWAHNWFNYATVPGRTDPSKRGAIDVAFDEYSTPVYDAADATGQAAVFITGWGHGDNLGAEAGLLDALSSNDAAGKARSDQVESWLALFDLYRATGQSG